MVRSPGSERDGNALCNECRSADWPSLLNGTMSGSQTSLFNHSKQMDPRALTPVSQILRKASRCPFCNLIAQLWGIVCQPPDEELAEKTLCYVSKDGIPEIDPLTSGFLTNSLDHDDLILAQVRFAKPNSFRGSDVNVHMSREEAFQDQTEPLRRIYLSRPEVHRAAQRLRTRSDQEIADGLLNIDLIKTWLGFCKSHDQCNSAHKGRQPENLRLIDVINRNIVAAPPSASYLALSYVWGELARYPGHGGTPKDGPRSVLGSVSRLPTDIPQTIEDACHLTLQLGQQYLWVDAFCIEQSDAKKRATQIMHMDQIYEGATLTIVAGAGATSRAGIAGVSRPLREIVQPTVETPFGKVRATFWRALGDAFDECQWNQRAWTLQEGVLSSRVLFIDDYNYTLRCREDVHMDVLRPHASKGQRTMPGDLFNGTVFLMSWYIDVITQYTRRSMSDPSDILNALTGMFNRIERNSKVSYYFGLPVNDYFVPSLLWYRRAALGTKPRPNFPSWSWCSQQGEVAYFDHLKSIWDGEGGEDGYEEHHSLESTRSPCATFRVPEDRTPASHKVQLRAHIHRIEFVVTRGDALCTASQTILLDHLVLWESGVYERDAILIQQRFSKSTSKRQARVMMGRPEWLFYLLVEPRGSSWQRIGVAMVASDGPKYNMKEGKWITLE